MAIDASEEGNEVKPSKKARTDNYDEAVSFIQSQLHLCLQLLQSEPVVVALRADNDALPIGNDLDKLQSFIESCGVKTSWVVSPRRGLSIHLQSCREEAKTTNGKEIFSDRRDSFLAMLGVHPLQTHMDEFYRNQVRQSYCIKLFCNRICEVCPSVYSNQAILSKISHLLRDPQRLESSSSCSSATSSVCGQRVKSPLSHSCLANDVVALIDDVIRLEPRHRWEVLKNEYSQIAVAHSTLFNALLTQFCRRHACQITDIIFRRSAEPAYERITMFVNDGHHAETGHGGGAPREFLFLPSLPTALRGGPEKLVKATIQSFWLHLDRCCGYFASSELKNVVSVLLERYLLSSFPPGRQSPMNLMAKFSPTSPLSLYLHGVAGSGKSSFTRHFPLALGAAIAEHFDPEIHVNFVKQNMNKPMDVLAAELDLRPNNNDLSVMGIIRGRRMSLSQNQPGLVVVQFEEMPSNDQHSDPRQLQVAQLLSQRLSGKKGEFRSNHRQSTSNTKRGIDGDFSVIGIFTSNYELQDESRQALMSTKLFESLTSTKLQCITGKHRRHLAMCYFQQCVKDHVSKTHQLNNDIETDLAVPLDNVDIRAMVTFLRMVSFFAGHLVNDAPSTTKAIVEVRTHEDKDKFSVSCGKKTIDLIHRASGVLSTENDAGFERNPHITRLQPFLHNDFKPAQVSDLSMILTLWLSRTLEPAVVVSTQTHQLTSLARTVSGLDNVHGILGVDVSHYKMMKSLYDEVNVPNLRDDIAKCDPNKFVAVELFCGTKDSQLCIREMIEDSPSLTAFSSANSALYKSGLLFIVHVTGDITPEIRSRASLIL